MTTFKKGKTHKYKNLIFCVKTWHQHKKWPLYKNWKNIIKLINKTYMIFLEKVLIETRTQISNQPRF